MQVSYSPWLVLLSIVLVIEGAYVGLFLTVKTGAAGGLRRRLLLAGAAFAFGAAAWVMHFIVLLVQAPLAADYVIFPTLLSFLVCVLLAGLAAHAIGAGPFTPGRLALAACLLAAAVVALHVIGMTALAMTEEAPLALAAGALVVLAGSALVLWLAFGRAGAPPLMLAATIFGLTVAAAHFTSLVGARIAAPPVGLTEPALSSSWLAIMAAVAAFAISAVFLLLLAPERVHPAPESLKAAVAAFAENEEAALPLAANPAPAAVTDAKLRRGTYAPLGGAGAPPPRVAEHLPIERDGATHFLPVEQVVAVQANAHYTYLFDGSVRLFCPLAIGEVESRLDRGRFLRVHRSHIVNIERVTAFRRSGDSETVELAADERYTVPVSRSRAGLLKSRIDEKNGGTDLEKPARS
ncbi:MAG: LytTR family transcriptional regulator DNA-binding domain-containing protein [Pseudolabrys sp.]